MCSSVCLHYLVYTHSTWRILAKPGRVKQFSQKLNTINPSDSTLQQKPKLIKCYFDSLGWISCIGTSNASTIITLINQTTRNGKTNGLNEVQPYPIPKAQLTTWPSATTLVSSTCFAVVSILEKLLNSNFDEGRDRLWMSDKLSRIRLSRQTQRQVDFKCSDFLPFRSKSRKTQWCASLYLMLIRSLSLSLCVLTTDRRMWRHIDLTPPLVFILKYHRELP